MPSFDYTPLIEPAPRAAVQHVRDEAEKAKIHPTDPSGAFLLGMSISGLALGAFMIFVVWYNAHPPFAGPLAFVLAFYFALFGSIELLFLVFGIPYSVYLMVTQWGQYYRAHLFAQRNDLTYSPTGPGPDWDGAIFRTSYAENPKVQYIFRSVSEPVFEVGNYHYQLRVDGVGRGKSSTRGVRWGYITVPLGQSVSHFVLRSKRRTFTQRRFLSRFNGNPVLSLGPAADRLFTLYGSAGAEAEARTVFTPELIDGLTRLGRGIDAEVIGTRLYVYSSKPFRLPNPRVMKPLFEIVSLATAPVTS